MELVFILFTLFILIIFYNLPNDNKPPTGFALKIRELFGADIRSLAIFRIALALLIIKDLLLRASDLKAHYTDEGVWPREVAIYFNNSWNLSFHFLSGTVEGQAVLFIIQGILAIFLLFGYRTKFVTIISWLFLTSLQNRNIVLNDVGDYVIRLVLFWSIFLPLGACYSVDNALSPSSKTSPKQILSFGTVAFFAQICFIYWFSVYSKLKVDEWQNGTAVFYAINLVTDATPFAMEMSKLPITYFKFLTRSVLCFELIGPLLLFSPIYTTVIRTLIVIGFVFFHLGLASCLNIGLIGWISMIAMLPFVPGKVWDAFSSWVPTSKAKHQTLSKLISIFGYRSNITTPTRLENIIAAFLVVYIFAWNVWAIEPKYKIPDSLVWIGSLLNLEQGWRMYTPIRGKFWDSGWPVFPGKLKDGTKVDIFTNSTGVNWEKPAIPTYLYKNRHWKKYFINSLTDEVYKINCHYFGSYICNQWNKQSKDNKQLQEFDMYWVIWMPQSDYTFKDTSRLFRWRAYCAENTQPVEKTIKDLEDTFTMKETLSPALYSAARDYLGKNKYLEASQLYEKALSVHEQIVGKDHPLLIETLEYLSAIYNSLGNHKEVERMNNRIKEIRAKQ